VFQKIFLRGKQIGGNFATVLTREGPQWRIAMLIGNLKPVRDVTGMAGATAKSGQHPAYPWGEAANARW
jgi:hypothetical protein